MAATKRILSAVLGLALALSSGCASLRRGDAEAEEEDNEGAPKELPASEPAGMPGFWKARPRSEPVPQPVPFPGTSGSLADTPLPRWARQAPQAAATPKPARGETAAAGKTASAASTRRPVVTPVPIDNPGAGNPAGTNAAAGDANAGRAARRLKAGDRITITLRGIPPEDQIIQDVIDQRGNVNMTYVGAMHIEGKTSAEAEELIEKAYIDGKYYKRINVSVLPPDSTYYMRGEVQRQGPYSLSRDVTFMQAIAIAGGYTEFHKKRAQVLRGKDVFYVDLKEIEQDPSKDQYVEPGDIIVVLRSVI